MEWVIALISSLAGTLLGWLLQFIKKRTLYFDKIELRPNVNDSVMQAYFKLNIYNTSQQTKSVRNPKIVFYNGKQRVLEERLQFSKYYKDLKEKEEAETYTNYINLLEIPACGSISQLCKIELYTISDNVINANLEYEDEKFKKRKLKVLWNLKEKKDGEV